jgi:uncharacterized membrane protein YecN with MAPEG domain
MALTVTPVFAGLLALLYVALGVRVIRARNTFRISIGDKGNAALQRCIRVHSNFAEYVPMALLLLLTLELAGAASWTLWILGAALLAGRLLHAYGVSQDPEPLPFRIAGMILTFSVLILTALANLALAISG